MPSLIFCYVCKKYATRLRTGQWIRVNVKNMESSRGLCSDCYNKEKKKGVDHSVRRPEFDSTPMEVDNV